MSYNVQYNITYYNSLIFCQYFIKGRIVNDFSWVFQSAIFNLDLEGLYKHVLSTDMLNKKTNFLYHYNSAICIFLAVDTFRNVLSDFSLVKI